MVGGCLRIASAGGTPFSIHRPFARRVVFENLPLLEPKERYGRVPYRTFEVLKNYS